MANYYVRNDGSDSNNGTAVGTAFKTMGKAVSVMTTSDTLTIAPDVPDASALISTDAGNDLELGTDGLLAYFE